MPAVSDVIRCPRSVAESGYLRIVAHEGNVSEPKELTEKVAGWIGWLVAEWDPVTTATKGPAFQVTDGELTQWASGDFDDSENSEDSPEVSD